MATAYLAAVALLVPSPVHVAGLDNGLGRLPPMGYNTWNDVECDGNTAENIHNVADAFINYGLDKLGYQYVNLDDCWTKQRDTNTHRLIPDPQAFPEGIKPVANYVHARGLKFGIYTDRGSFTCAARPGSEGHEWVDAQTFADWGVDYVKEDSCNAPKDHDKAFEQYRIMRDALNATGRPIYFSLCGWKAWYAPVGAMLANSWRVALDVRSWESLWNAASINSRLAEFASPGAWNDPDMLLGNVRNSVLRLTPTQTRTQFSLWSIMAAPLIIGSSIPQLKSHELDTYRNTEVIAVDQDPLGIQGTILWEDCPHRELLDLQREAKDGLYPVPDCRQVWSRQLVDGARAVLIINWAQTSNWTWVTVGPDLMGAMGFAAGADVRDLWEHSDLGVHHTFQSCILGDGSSKMYRFSPPTHIV
jgi:alpha-galactosidase